MFQEKRTAQPGTGPIAYGLVRTVMEPRVMQSARHSAHLTGVGGWGDEC